MYKYKRSILLSFVLLLSLVFITSSEAAKVVTREEFLSALYDARGIELTAGDLARKADIKIIDVGKGGKKSERNVSVRLRSASDKAEACFKLGYVGMPITGINKVNAPAIGQLSAPITRIEAIRYIIQSLGLSFEAFVLSRIPSSFSDISQYSPFERGCVSVAERMIPPILDINEKVTKTFRPNDQLTTEELSRFMMNARNATNNLLLSLTVSPAEGITIKIHREGVYTGVPKWRVNLHGFISEEEAKAAAEQISELEMTPFVSNHEWGLRGALLDDWRHVERAYNMFQAYDKKIAIVPSVANAEGKNPPLYWVLASVPPEKYRFRVLTPPMGISTLSPMSHMHKGGNYPIFAVNAGFFTWTGRLRGYPIGTLLVDGELASAPYLRRTTIGWGENNAPIFGFPKWGQEIKLPFAPLETLSSINFYSRKTFLTAYTPIYGIPTPTPEIATTEIFIKDGQCVRKAYGGTTLKEGEVILAGYGVKALLLDNINPGDQIDIDFGLTQDVGDYNDWGSVTNAIQAGPMLLEAGHITMDYEGFENNFVNNRHPRSVVGIDSDGYWMFFVGDGRNGMHSAGFSLYETALIMRENGAIYALNFDGGGSSEILVKEQLFNWPSEGKERAINNAIGVYDR